MASAPSASRSPAVVATPAEPGSQPLAQPAADITALTTRDEFLLGLGETLGGRAGVHPADTLQAALAQLSAGKRGQVLVIDAAALSDVRGAVAAAHAAAPAAVVVVFAAEGAAKPLAAQLKGSKVFALLPTPTDARKTQAVLERAITEALAMGPAARAAAPAAGRSLGALRPAPPQSSLPAPAKPVRRLHPPLIAAAAAAAAIAAAGVAWISLHGGARKTHLAPAAAPPALAPRQSSAAPPAADTAVLHGRVDELLEKARLAMHDRRFTEPPGDNALLYYRSAAAADSDNGEARDGLARIAAVLAGRFGDAMNGARFEEAALTLASFKAAAPGDARAAAFEQRLYSGEIAHALSEGNFDRATGYLHQAQESRAVPAQQLAKWRAEIARRQEDSRVQHLAGLVEDRIHDGKLTGSDDSARVYLQQLQAAAPAYADTQRTTREYVSACLRRAREAALAKMSTEEQRWLGEARAAGLNSADLAAYQKELTGARHKAAQAESERLLQLARARLGDGHLTDPPQDSAAGYLTQLRASDPGNPGLADAGHELAQRLLDRARAAILAGKADDGDLDQARQWGADTQALAAVQQLNAPKALDPAALAARLKRVSGSQPNYPQTAFDQHISGSVTLEYTVDTHGATRDVHVIEATPPRVFDQAAINAVKHWRYAPVIVDGAAIEVPMKTRVRFELPK